VHIRLFFTVDRGSLQPGAWGMFYVVWGRVLSQVFLQSPVCVAPVRCMAVQVFITMVGE
jgi:hypothetical protein